MTPLRRCLFLQNKSTNVNDEGEVRPVAYEETASYQVTELFINNRTAVLRNLLDGET